jgi:hypothetical protein
VAGDDQKGLLRIALAVLCLVAAVVLFQILTAEHLDSEESTKAFYTAIPFAFLSLAVGSGARLVARQPGIAGLGYATMAVGAVALLLTLNLIWRGDLYEGPTTVDKWAWYTLIGTIGLGLASMLLSGHDDDDADSVKLVRGMTVFALLGLFLAVIAEVSESGERVDAKLLGSFSVFFILGSLSLPLLNRLSR